MGPLQGLAWCFGAALLAGTALGVSDRVSSRVVSLSIPQMITARAANTAEDNQSADASPSELDVVDLVSYSEPLDLPPGLRPELQFAFGLSTVSLTDRLEAFNFSTLRVARSRRQSPTLAASASLLAFLPDPLPRPIKGAEIAEVDLQTLGAIAPSMGNTPPFYALNEAGYAALARGDDAEALAQFSQSLERSPAQPAIQKQIGYIEKARGNYAKARDAFEAASAYGRVQPGLQREINQLSRPLRLSGYTVWRQNSRQINDAAFGPSLAQSQSGIGARYQVPLDGWASLHGLSVTSRLLWAYEPESLSPDGRTVQAGLGLQVRPFQTLNLALAAERLIAIGEDSRSDWLLRAAYSAGRGYEPVPGEDWWLHWSGYLDAAMIDPADPDIQILADGRIGAGHRPIDTSSLTLIPFLGLSGSFEDAAGRSTDLYEAAAGVWLRLWPGGPEITDPFRALDLRLEYREKLGGDSPSSSGLRLTVGVTY